MKFTRNIDELNKNDVVLAGGKGASLGEMARAGILIPPGFAVLASAFDIFLAQNSLSDDISSLLRRMEQKNIIDIQNMSKKITGMIKDAKMPIDIANDIMVSFAKLDTKYAVVRSSATAEDSASAAWAGQLESYLGITEKNLLESVKKCWASLFSTKALSYRFAKQLEGQKISVAVVVQKMIDGVTAGTAFSADPVTQKRSTIIIEAVFGLGQALVSGNLTPDSYSIDKNHLRIINKNIPFKPKGLYRARKGNIVWRNLSRLQETRQVLPDQEILSLAKVILKIEDLYGFPCDIEWVTERGKCYIVQSRKITTINKAKQEYRQIMTRPLDLAMCECWDAGERIMLPKKFKDLLYFDPLFIYKPGQAVTVYYNFSDPKQSLTGVIIFLEKNLPWFLEQKEKFDETCEKIRLLIKNEFADYRIISRMIGEIWPMIAIANVLGSTEIYKVSQNLRDICIKIRVESDDVLHPALSCLSAAINEEIAKSHTALNDYGSFILLSEMINNNLPDKDTLIKRSTGYLFHKGNLYSNTDEYIRNNQIELSGFDNEQSSNGPINGQTASGGIVSGNARIIMELADLNKIKEGDIIVTPMTTPEMTLALNLAAGIVTDEGGITCHAAIISRELHKPCIIGTKSATKMINDGDQITIDGDHGSVTISRKASI